MHSYIGRRRTCFSESPVSVAFENELPFQIGMFHTTDHSLNVII